MAQQTAADDDAQIETISDNAHIFQVPADSCHSDWLLKAAKEDGRKRPAPHKNEYTFEVIRDWGDMKTVAVWD